MVHDSLSRFHSIRLSFGLWPYAVAILFCHFVGCDRTEISHAPALAANDNSSQVTDGFLVTAHAAKAPLQTNESIEASNFADTQMRDAGHSFTNPSNSNAGPQPNNSQDQRPPVLVIKMRDSIAAGVPIGLFSDKTLVMRNDGAIQTLDNENILSRSVTEERFVAINRNELVNELRSEFGRNYAIKQEGPYYVVARAEHMQAWTQRFRSIHHSVQLYCRTRQLLTRDIEFPLVAVVFGTKNEFLRYAQLEGATLPPNCVGYYSQNSNRIVLFESPVALGINTLETICHEATHQLAFNTGLHQRLSSTPLWLAEGFATMFESPSLSGLNSRDRTSMWPESRRQEWRELVKQPEIIYRLIDGMIRSDKPFKIESQKAYCVSWAMTAYLSQRRPKQFSLYMTHVANRPPYEDYEAPERAFDFQKIFGTDSRLLAKNVIGYIESLE
jgi:hypothetical protein